MLLVQLALRFFVVCYVALIFVLLTYSFCYTVFIILTYYELFWYINFVRLLLFSIVIYNIIQTSLFYLMCAFRYNVSVLKRRYYVFKLEKNQFLNFFFLLKKKVFKIKRIFFILYYLKYRKKTKT